MKKYSSMGNELKDLTLRLSQLNFYQNSNIFLELGTPVKPDEIRIRFQLALNPRPSESDGAIFTVDNLIELAFSQNLKISQIKESLCEELMIRYPTISIKASHMRFRYNVYSITTKILGNNEFLKDSKPSDKIDICVQLLKGPERPLDGNDLIIYVKVWNPSTWELSNPFEIILNKNLRINDLGLCISKETEIEVTCIQHNYLEITCISYPQNYQRVDLLSETFIRTFKNQNYLSSAPLHLNSSDALLM
jgi:hypothetical protein